MNTYRQIYRLSSGTIYEELSIDSTLIKIIIKSNYGLYEMFHVYNVLNL